VTALSEQDDGRSYWTLHGPVDEPCSPGQLIRKKQKLRLQHAASRRWLHSHELYNSPLSGNQEVSAHGGDHKSDAGDVWTVDWSDKKAGSHWKQDVKVVLQHVETKGFLHSLKQAVFGHPIHGQREVCAVKKQGPESQWYAAEGVYMPQPNGTRGGEGTAGKREEL